MGIKIVSDSSSNVFTLEDIDYANVPLKIITSEAEYVDEPSLDIERMVTEVKATKGKSGTSCPNIHEWTEAFGEAKEVIAVTITSKLSGSFAAAKHAAEAFMAETGAKVFVLDTLSAGPEMRLIIEKLREYIKNGLSLEQVKEAITKYQQHSHVLFCLQSLTNLARNGRVNPAVAKIAGVLGIRIIGAGNEGEIQPIHKCRGEAKALETLFKEMKSRGFAGGKVSIAHCLNLESAEILKEKILSAFPQCSVRIENCGALCSFYAERGGLIVGFEDALAP